MYRYLASPYSHEFPSVRKLRAHAAMCATAYLLRNGIYVYSPIVHCHDLAVEFKLPTDIEFWREYNMNMLRPATNVLVLRICGLFDSKGVKEEIVEAINLHKDIEFVDFTDDKWNSCHLTPAKYNELKQGFGI